MRKNRLNRIGIFFLFFFIVLVVVKWYIDKKELEKSHHYCIGFVYKWRALSTQGATLYFYFYLNGKKYESDDVTYDRVRKFLNKQFYVEFSPKNPKNNQILLDRPITDTLLVQPPEGWEFLPE